MGQILKLDESILVFGVKIVINDKITPSFHNLISGLLKIGEDNVVIGLTKWVIVIVVDNVLVTSVNT